jgi:hypothetical protein
MVRGWGCDVVSRSRARSSCDDRLRYYLDNNTNSHVLDSTLKRVEARMYLKTGDVHQLSCAARRVSISIKMCSPVGAGAPPCFGLAAPVLEVLYLGTITVQPCTLSSKLGSGMDKR